MAKDRKTYLRRDGQSRKQRLASAPAPLSVRIDGRTEEDLLSFASRYAKEVRFFDLSNTPAGDWTPFFAEVQKIDDGTVTPHTALFRAFLSLFSHNQDQLNRVTGRHLELYYRDILRMERKGPVPDRVHLVFELKKNSPDQLVKAGTLFKAGKDSGKKDLLYALQEDLIVTPASITDLRSVYTDPSGGAVHIAPVANSGDGLGGPLDKDNPRWSPFGQAGLPVAEPGFAIASPILLMKEGTRKVTVRLALSGISDDTGFQQAKNGFDLYLTGEKGWIGPKNVTLTSPGQGLFFFEITLQPDDGPVVPFSQERHGGGFETSSPLMQLLLRADQAGRYSFFRDAIVQAIELRVDVSGLRGLALENDLGRIDGSKPFMPFGPQPQEGSSLSIGCDEAFSKKLDGFSLTMKWKAPSDLSAVYKNYSTKVTNSSFRARLISPEGNTWDVGLFDPHNASAPVKIPSEMKPHSPLGQAIAGAGDLGLFRQSSRWAMGELERLRMVGKTFAPSFGKLTAGLAGEIMPSIPQRNSAVLRLGRDFLHSEYRRLYVENAISLAKSGTGSLPGEPYTPVLESLSLSYTASTGRVDPGAEDKDSFLKGDIELFHIGAFGQKREQGFLKTRLSFVSDRRVFLLPQYRSEGELYIGVKGLRPGQELALFFQVDEGSANPERERAELRWSVLSDNEWRGLTPAGIVSDTTKGLLTSGIVRLSIPDDATDRNTILPAGLYWLSCSVRKDTDAVSLLIDLRPNAAAASFQDQGNDPLRLKTPLPPKSIKKSADEIPSVKAVDQPFGSFGGQMAEDDRSFYARVSERLRHKERAVGLWDYERLLLERFPSVYRARCLNHTSPSSGEAPGHVTLVVIPDTRNRNGVDPFRPKVDKNSLSEISSFLAERTGGFVEIHTENPSYEEVRVRLRVMFTKGKDFGYYSSLLNDEIRRFLSPWAYEEGEDISFGGVFRKSAIISFLEERDYLDYLEEVTMHHIVDGREGPDTELIEASGPKAILVSAAEHMIERAGGGS